MRTELKTELQERIKSLTEQRLLASKVRKRLREAEKSPNYMFCITCHKRLPIMKFSLIEDYKGNQAPDERCTVCHEKRTKHTQSVDALKSKINKLSLPA